MNYVPLGIKTDYSLLKSLIKIDSLIDYIKEQKINTIGILDNNLFGCMEFYFKCKKNKIKPIIGIEIKYNNYIVYLYAKNFQGLQNLFILGQILEERELTETDLDLYNLNVIFVLPYSSYNLYKDLEMDNLYLCYSNEEEKRNALVISDNIVYLNITRMFNKNESDLLNYLEMIESGKVVLNYPFNNYTNNYLKEIVEEGDAKTTISFCNQIDIELPIKKNYLPKYEVEDNVGFLKSLSVKGLKKRLNGDVPDNYQKRLLLELKVIEEMDFIDYFLIVYDYILFAKRNNILVGPGRGSAAGSLVSYSLGITDIDPLKYNLLFERFLNKERITMPDIDIDFEDTRRDEIKSYLINKYGADKVASIMTYGTLGSKQVLRDVIKLFNPNEKLANDLLKEINANLSLRTNYDKNIKLKKLVDQSDLLKKIYSISIRLEGLKKQISTHAAGVVISDISLNKIIPISKSGNNYLTGVTMEYLESLGLLKMDLLALNNLTIIRGCLDLLQKLKLSDIPLDDKKTFELFSNAETEAIFQFESAGMKNFLRKLKPKVFSDLYAAVALYRPGPMENIDLFINRKSGKIKIDYLHPDLENILKETYGIIVYQEQIIQILTKMAGYSFSESDVVRKSMSKKDYKVLSNEKEKFVNGSIENGYEKELADLVFEHILKFASYGFNKAHSVSYALISYQLAYLKANYPLEFMTNLLNMSLGSVNKTKEYLDMAKKLKIKIEDFNLNTSKDKYYILDNKISLPISLIKGINPLIQDKLLNNFSPCCDDIFDFVIKCSKLDISKDIVEKLIKVGVLDFFEFNRQTLLNNLDKIYDYARLAEDLDRTLVSKPLIELYPEMKTKDLLQNEIDLVGFYISNHPTNEYYINKMIKMNNIDKYFDKQIEVVVLVERIKVIKTKKNEEMAFITASDETGSNEFILFPKSMNLISDFKENKVLIILGKVTRRNEKYGIIINSVKNIGDNE